ncbi:MAG: cation:proton antiporter [Deltaproteobacteria bacterium]
MMPDNVPLIVGLIVFASSLISLRVGLSVTIIEIILGTVAGALGLKTEEWMMYLAGFGGIVLTFLAGAEIDTRLMRERFKESLLIGSFSFLTPFVGGFLFAYYLAGWDLPASLITGIALSETSIAVVYSVLVETKIPNPAVGKMIMAATFITNTGTALALSILFVKPTLYTLAFIIVSIIVIFLAVRFSHKVFDNPKLKNKVIEPEIKYIFFLLLVFMYFANLGQGHAVLPAFILGLLMSGHFTETSETKVVKSRLRTVAFAIITPSFFIVAGLKVSLPVIISSFGLFLSLFAVKQLTKFAGVYFFAKRYIPDGGGIYSTLLMSTGLTFGLIAIVFGLQSGFIDQEKYSVLTGVLIASAVIPTFIAQKWFLPVHSEDIPE